MIEWIVTSSILICVVLLLRFLFRGRIGVRLQYGLWLLVLVRLLVPLSIPAPSSVMNALPKAPALDQPIAFVGYDAEALPDLAKPERNPALPEAQQQVQYQQALEQYNEAMDAAKAETGIAVTPEKLLLGAWLLGMAVVGTVLLISNLRFGRMLRKNRSPMEQDYIPLQVFTCPNLQTPCLFGLFRPRVYLPESLSGEAQLHVLHHEYTHFRQWDHLWAFLRCVCLAVHWYNPLVWAAASLSKKDSELSCDEGTVRRLGEDARVPYGKTLITMTSTGHTSLITTATTMTGNHRTLKARIHSIAKHPKTPLVALLCMILALTLAVGCTFTSSKEEEKESASTLHAYFADPSCMTASELADFPHAKHGTLTANGSSDHAAIVYSDHMEDMYSSCDAYLVATIGGQLVTQSLDAVPEDAPCFIHLQDVTADGVDEIFVCIIGPLHETTMCRIYTPENDGLTLLMDLNRAPSDIVYTPHEYRIVSFSLKDGTLTADVNLSYLFNPDSFTRDGFLRNSPTPYYTPFIEIPTIENSKIHCTRTVFLANTGICQIQYTLSYDPKSKSLNTESFTLIPHSEDHPAVFPTIVHEGDNRNAFATVQQMVDSSLFNSIAEFYTTPSLTLYWVNRLATSRNNYGQYNDLLDASKMSDAEILSQYHAFWIIWDPTSENVPGYTDSDPWVYIIMKDPETGEWVGCIGHNALF